MIVGLVELGKVELVLLVPKRNPVFLKFMQWIEHFALREVYWLNSSSKEGIKGMGLVLKISFRSTLSCA